MSQTPRLAFSILNGRTVYDNGVVRIWECSNCKWWRAWEQEKCNVCGASRDGNLREREGAVSVLTVRRLADRARSRPGQDGGDRQ